ncbi:MAG TPA: helix-turn-helix transcriptional regulator [Candidatus Ruania gallistercoris]|uniref:Helix-turn-helix transcriptional regulator n=1 Tax=Candidatus Ruania gallistercoris TaxID=2838746 RepID=A0A9D2EDX2_9MICO|nr:helix-turn-helix transcriptional regulator [Candidatus Ruania gallistercoris]
MSPSVMTTNATGTGRSAGQLIQRWRAARRMSQMVLAHEAGISPRHLSFVETGRSAPSRTTLHKVGAALDLSLREKNTLLLTAGYAPPHPSTPWTAPEWQDVHRSLTEMVQASVPFPAMVVDANGDILLANSVLLTLLGDLAADQQPLNTYRLVLAPGGIADRIVNAETWQSLLTTRLLERAAETDDPALPALATPVPPRSRIAPTDQPAVPAPVVPLLLTYGQDVLTLASVRAHLTEPRDVTAAELCLETFIPLDTGTRTVLEKLAGTPQP